jgi:hypothetical protein
MRSMTASDEVLFTGDMEAVFTNHNAQIVDKAVLMHRLGCGHAEGLPKLTQDLVDMLGTYITDIDFQLYSW